MSTLEIRLFGTLSLARGGEPLARFPSKRLKNLLCYLLLNRDTRQPRERVAGLFWCEVDDRRARHCLNTSIWRLNQVLDHPGCGDHPYLRIDVETIGFNTASDFWLDVAEFESCCALAREAGPAAPDQQAAFHRRAVSLYRSDLLIGCYDDWCVIERERLVRMYVRALGQLVAYHSERGEHDAAIDHALRILTCDPLREEVHRELIQLYLATHRPADALRQYRLCEDLVRRELDIEPMPETQVLLPRIMEAAGAAGLGTAADMQPVALAHGVVAALATLQQAAASVETAYAQLLEARARVEEVVGLAREAIPIPLSLREPAEIGNGQVHRGRSLIAEATSQLETVTKLSSA
ncbi:MAG: bacterial transcriptional activator domain-containing protein [Chloroflexi bacterium]|nr:bacterial transcriptional activator domain-containing protein [Chloroflexota bacterium]